jgi:hypothetical protein
MNTDNKQGMLICLVSVIGIVVGVVIGAVVLGPEYKTGFRAGIGIGAGLGCIFVESVFLFCFLKITRQM